VGHRHSDHLRRQLPCSEFETERSPSSGAVAEETREVEVMPVGMQGAVVVKQAVMREEAVTQVASWELVLS